MASKKLLLFGAGKIGRSFIGQLFSRAGYEVVFVDVNQELISELNRRGSYKVVIKSEHGDEEFIVGNIRAIHADDESSVIEEVTDADLAAVSVGQKGIPGVSSIIARGLMRRYRLHPDLPLNIILAENLRDGAKVVRREIAKHIDIDIDLNKYFGLVETSIGKMVPIMPVEQMERDPLLVFAEPHNTLILDGKAFCSPVPKVPGLDPKQNIGAWVDRKSFIHNLGHAAAAYYGNYRFPNLVYMHEIMAKRDIVQTTRQAMIQASEILIKHHPDEFTREEVTEHIDDLLIRFSNKALGDTVFRVGQDLRRKLGPQDRLVSPLKLALKYRMPYEKILYIIACATRFTASNEFGERNAGDREVTELAKSGLRLVLERVCELDPEIYRQVYNKAIDIKL